MKGSGTPAPTSNLLQVPVPENRADEARIAKLRTAIEQRRLEATEFASAIGKAAREIRQNVVEDFVPSGQIYTALMLHLAGGFAVVDHSGKLVRVSQRYAQIFGYDSPAQLIGKNWRELVAPESNFTADKVYQDMLRDNYGVAYLHAVRKDGSHFEERLILVRDDLLDGEEPGTYSGHHQFAQPSDQLGVPLATSKLFNDTRGEVCVTSFSEALLHAGEMVRSMMLTMPFPVLHLAGDGTVKSLNQLAAELGFKRKELITARPEFSTMDFPTWIRNARAHPGQCTWLPRHVRINGQVWKPAIFAYLSKSPECTGRYAKYLVFFPERVV